MYAFNADCLAQIVFYIYDRMQFICNFFFIFYFLAVAATVYFTSIHFCLTATESAQRKANEKIS